MLSTLRISGFAVVDRIEVRFGPGLNVLTGETGAGKSLLVNALHLILGGRMSGDLLREGADEAVVEALLELPPGHPALARLEAAGLPAADGAGADGEILVRRTVGRNGRGRVFVNGALCTVAMLETILRGVVDVTGQHEHVTLLDASTHLGLVDAFAGSAAPGGTLARYREAFAELAARVKEQRALADDEAERIRRADYLAFQLQEFDATGPEPGEDEALELERRRLASADRLTAAARGAEALAYGDEGSAAERLGEALRLVAEAAALDPRLEGPVALLRSAAAEAEEAGRELARYAESVGGDAERLAEVEERLAALRALARKHGGSLAAALARRDEMRAELERSAGASSRAAELEAIIAARGREAAALATELGAARRRAARAFQREVEAQLSQLAMGRCRVEVCFSPPEGALEVAGARLGPSGAETAEIQVAPNAGEPARPLGRVASGGELSRLLLAVKRALSRADPVSCYVFDEVDAGVGGAVAEAVGRALAGVARERQVICVTHLPQVAAFADRHCRVEKRVEGGRTSTRWAPLDAPDERRAELARMLAGQTVTDSALRHAASLLEQARRAEVDPAGGTAIPRSRGRSAARRSEPARA